MHNKYELTRVISNTYVLDNETSDDLKEAFKHADVKFQLVPPHNHCNNLAERAIHTYKHHVKAGSATVDPNFLLSEWYRRVEQGDIKLNLHRAARSNPKLFAYSFLFGNFNFKSAPLAPPGTKIVTHIKTSVFVSWELNEEKGWYVGSAL